MVIFLFFIIFLRVLLLRALFRAKFIFYNLVSNISYLFLSVFFTNYYLVNVLFRWIAIVLILSSLNLDPFNYYISSSSFQYFFAASSAWRRGSIIIIFGNGLGCVLFIVSMPSVGSIITAENRLLTKYWLRFSLFFDLVLAQVVSSFSYSLD